MDIDDFTRWCNERGDRIFVRAFVDGRWDTCPLSSLTPDDQRAFIADWHASGRAPIVLDEEVPA